MFLVGLFLAVHNSTKWRKPWLGHKAFSNNSWSQNDDRSTGQSFALLYCGVL